MGLEARAYLVAECDSGRSCERITQRPPMHSSPLTVVDQALRAGWAVGTDDKGHFLMFCADSACQKKSWGALKNRHSRSHSHAVSETECDDDCAQEGPHGSDALSPQGARVEEAPKGRAS